PGGPQKIIECSAPCSSASRSGLPLPSRCSWPTYSSRLAARRRAARGWAIGGLPNRSKRLVRLFLDHIHAFGNLEGELIRVENLVHFHAEEEDVGALTDTVDQLHVIDHAAAKGQAQAVEQGIAAL